ncbi:hypothetical protein BBP40_010386 [Aspergillus hancockii]|nr:hypothetical protein BBP40_010386 [Aspergillus hancockii]
MARPFDIGSKITTIIHGVIDSFLNNTTAYSLEDSRHAPQAEESKQVTPQRRSSAKQQSSFPSGYQNPFVFHTPSPSPCLSANTPSSNHSSQKSTSKSSQELQHPTGKTTMYPVADVDDTAGFLAAARARKLDMSKYRTAPSVVEDAPSEHGSLANSQDDLMLTSTPKEANTPLEYPVMSNDELGGSDRDNLLSDFAAAEPKLTKVAEESTASKFTSTDNFATISRVSVEEEQDREHLATFKAWGTPEVRDKPAARVRKILIKGLPYSWATPAKVLSLIHGGTIESVFVAPSGTAHILFCEHEACQAFYDKYPNGIDLDTGKVTVFVEIGKEVDVIGSQLSFSLSTGATRAVRAVGVDLDVNMRQLSEIATGSHRKVEKILDAYVPGDARNVIFRFCAIDDAVRFRSMLVRNEQWEHCNIQYAADPCELATGFHTD